MRRSFWVFICGEWEVPETMNPRVALLQFLAHLVTADRQIDLTEVERFRELAREQGLVEHDQAGIQQILTGAPDAPTLAETLDAMAGSKHRELQRTALWAGLQIVYADGYLDPLEETVFAQALARWQIPRAEFDQMKLTALQAAAAAVSPEDQDGEQSEPASFQDRYLTPATLGLLKMLHRLGVPGLEHRIATMQNRLLLAGPEYANAIRQCSAVAEADFALASRHLEACAEILRLLSDEIATAIRKVGSGRSKDHAQLRSALKALEEQVQSVLLSGIEQSQAALHRKERAMHMFTISFLGRTKAGKSTLHAVITGEGFDAIGRGKQRTTRFRRVYRWKNLRIIDTPGIEAPQEGGEQDQRIAESVLDESDIVCFVLINDSQQPAELDFLGSIRDRNKPVVILLNVKEDLTQPPRLKRFLRNPDHWATRTDAKSLRGHLQRIERYARERYRGGPIRVIPVHLLAARMSRQEEYRRHAAALFRGSRIREFLDALRVAVIEEGVLRRSQTLLDGSRYNLEQATRGLREKTAALSELLGHLKEKQQGLGSKFDRSFRRRHANLMSEIADLFRELRNGVWDFAYRHYNKSESELESAWARHVRRMGLDARLKAAADRHLNAYLKDVQDALEEIAADFDLLVEEGLANTAIVSSSTFPIREIFRVGGAILTVAGVLLISNPVGWVLTIGGILASLFGGLFKSREERRREAAEQIYDSIMESLDENEASVTRDADQQFRRAHRDVKKKVADQLKAMIQALDGLVGRLEPAVESLQQRLQELDEAFAYRALNFIRYGNEAPADLSREAIREVVLAVARDFGRQMTILTPLQVSEAARQRLSRNLGEEIVIARRA